MDELNKSLSRTIDSLYSNALTRDDRIRYLNEIKGLISNYEIEIGHNHDIRIHSQPESNRDIMDTLNLKESINELNKLSNQLESKNVIYVPVEDVVPQQYSLSPEPHENAYQLLVKENEQYKIDLETARAAEAKALADAAISNARALAAAADTKVVTRLNAVIDENKNHPMVNSLMNGIFSTMLTNIKTESVTNNAGHIALYTKLKLLLDRYNKMQTVIFDIIKKMCDTGAPANYSALDVVTSYNNHTKAPAPLLLLAAGEVYNSAINDTKTYAEMITLLDTKLVADRAALGGADVKIVFIPKLGYVNYLNIDYKFMHFLLNLSFDHLCNFDDMTASNAAYKTNNEIKDLYINDVADKTSILQSKQINVENLNTNIGAKLINTNHIIINQLLQQLIKTISDAKDCDYITNLYSTLCAEIDILSLPYNGTITYIKTLELSQTASPNHISITDIINALETIDKTQLKTYIDGNTDISIKDPATGAIVVTYKYINSKDLNAYRFYLLKEEVNKKGATIKTLEYIGTDKAVPNVSEIIDILVRILNFPFQDKAIDTKQDYSVTFDKLINDLKSVKTTTVGGNNPLMDSKKANLSSRLTESHNYDIKKYGSSDIFFNHNSNISTIFTIIIMLLLCILIVIYIHNKKKYQHKMYNNCNLFMKDI